MTRGVRTAAGAAPEEIRDRYDVVIAGGRVAGAATGLLLARRGLRVLIVDPVPPERDALSTLAIMRAGVLQLRRWGLLEAIRDAGTPTIRTTTFHYSDDPVVIPIKEKDGVDGLYAPRRTVLDRMLLDAAIAAGARVVHGAAVAGLDRGPGGRVVGARLAGTLEGRSVAAGLVVGADGLRSRVAREVAAPYTVETLHASATVYGFWPTPFEGAYNWYFAPGVSAGVIPTNDGLSCVFGAVPSHGFDALRARGLRAGHRWVLEQVSPALAARIGDTRPVGRLRAFGGVPGFIRRSAGPGWALVGDAGFFKDPATAHGITDALRDAELLADAAAGGGDVALRRYEEQRDQVALGVLRTTDRIASHEWDLGELRALHHQLAEAMNAGLATVRAMDAVPAAV